VCVAAAPQLSARLARPPLNLQTDEVLGAVVERLLKAMHQTHPQTVRQFFGLANQHIRWELNDLARRLDEQTRAGPLPDERRSRPSPKMSVRFSAWCASRA
jgi:hypothetical protein